MLQRVLRGRLIFTPHVNPVSKEIDGYEFEGPTRLYQLLTGLAVERPKGLPDSRAGYEGITPDDTFDSDYGRLLEKRFHAEVLASPRGTGIRRQPIFEGIWVSDKHAA